MTVHVLDAHPLIWFIEGNSRLSRTCKAICDDPSSNLVLPATALAEALWVIERGRTTLPSPAALLAAIDADPRITIYSLDRAVLDTSLTLTAIGEMHDRQIVATALLLAQRGDAVALLTKDGNITTSGLVHCIW